MVVLALPLVCISDVFLTMWKGSIATFYLESDNFIYQRDMAEIDEYTKFSLDMQGPFTEETVFTVSLYENSPDEVPFHITTETVEPTSLGYSIALVGLWNAALGNAEWNDGQAVIKLEIQEGSASITEISASTVIDGKLYTAAIPEPSSAAFLLVGAGVFYLRKQKNKTIQPAVRAYRFAQVHP